MEIGKLLEIRDFNDENTEILENYLLPLKREYVKTKQEIVKYLLETSNQKYLEALLGVRVAQLLLAKQT